MVALQLPSLMPPLYRGDGSLLKFLEFTVFTFRYSFPLVHIYIYTCARNFTSTDDKHTSWTVDDLEKRIKENIAAWIVELGKSFSRYVNADEK